MDFGVFTSELNDNEESTKSHFFSNTNINFIDNFFESLNLEINFEQVSHDTYLKKFKPPSELIKNENLMNNFLRVDGYNDDTSFSLVLESYEDLTKPISDRYEYIYPDLDFTKEFISNDIPGYFSLSSNFYQRQDCI